MFQISYLSYLEEEKEYLKKSCCNNDGSYCLYIAKLWFAINNSTYNSDSIITLKRIINVCTEECTTWSILCSVLNWRKLWGSNWSTRKSNPVRVSVNVHRAAGRTFYMRVRCASCTLAMTNAHGRINWFAGG